VNPSRARPSSYCGHIAAREVTRQVPPHVLSATAGMKPDGQLRKVSRAGPRPQRGLPGAPLAAKSRAGVSLGDPLGEPARSGSAAVKGTGLGLHRFAGEPDERPDQSAAVRITPAHRDSPRVP